MAYRRERIHPFRGTHKCVPYKGKFLNSLQIGNGWDIIIPSNGNYCLQYKRKEDMLS